MNETSTTASQAGDASPSEWIAFERLLADLAAKFANVEAATIESEIERAPVAGRWW